jgi:GntR family transcriptional regulator
VLLCYLTSTLMSILFRLNHSSAVPLYIQVMDQVKHAVETGALHPGDQLPTMRKLAEDLVMNPNTVIRAYRELEHEGVIELRQGSGAFISEAVMGRTKVMRKAQTVAESAIERLTALGLTEEEMRRVLESELASLRTGIAKKGKHE